MPEIVHTVDTSLLLIWGRFTHILKDSSRDSESALKKRQIVKPQQ